MHDTHESITIYDGVSLFPNVFTRVLDFLRAAYGAIVGPSVPHSSGGRSTRTHDDCDDIDDR